MIVNILRLQEIAEMNSEWRLPNVKGHGEFAVEFRPSNICTIHTHDGFAINWKPPIVQLRPVGLFFNK